MRKWPRVSLGVISLLGMILSGCNFPEISSATATATLTAAPSAPPAPTSSPSPPATEAPTATLIATPTVIERLVSVRTDANCRAGPGTIYRVREVLPTGATARALTRNLDDNNVWLEVEVGASQTCWMSIITLDLGFSPSELPVGIIPPTPTFTPGEIVGTVWHDICDDESPDLAFCKELAEGDYVGNGLLDLGEPTIVGVTVHLGAGDCPSIGLTTDETGPNESGGYQFSNLKPGKYCVSVDADAQGNEDILQPGVWTAPEVGESSLAGRTITVESDETTAAVTFGWDFSELP